jgi:hypothetical protein
LPELSTEKEPTRVNATSFDGVIAPGLEETTNIPWPLMARSVPEEVCVSRPCCWTRRRTVAFTPPAL